MENTEKNNFRIKIILIILYIVFCLIGFPLIFIFPPRKFLFSEDSIDEENKKYLFKNFVSEIHDNINKKLIRNITLTKENDDCPENFETLSININIMEISHIFSEIVLFVFKDMMIILK